MLKASEVLAATKAVCADFEFTGVTTDSRAVKPGELFVALKGDNFDGHDYCAKAVELGAAGVVVSHEVSGLPAGVAMGLPIPVAFIASLVGNMIPVPFIILFVRPLFKWVRIHIPKLEGFISHLEARAEAKSADVLRYQTWGLLIFVAIPLPGTGAWTGALIAAVLNMRLKRAVPVIFLGVVIAGCIITLLTHGVTLLF